MHVSLQNSPRRTGFIFAHLIDDPNSYEGRYWHGTREDVPNRMRLSINNPPFNAEQREPSRLFQMVFLGVQIHVVFIAKMRWIRWLDPPSFAVSKSKVKIQFIDYQEVNSLFALLEPYCSPISLVDLLARP